MCLACSPPCRWLGKISLIKHFPGKDEPLVQIPPVHPALHVHVEGFPGHCPLTQPTRHIAGIASMEEHNKPRYKRLPWSQSPVVVEVQPALHTQVPGARRHVPCRQPSLQTAARAHEVPHSMS
jgi:hypothetical protein